MLSRGTRRGVKTGRFGKTAGNGDISGNGLCLFHLTRACLLHTRTGFCRNGPVNTTRSIGMIHHHTGTGGVFAAMAVNSVTSRHTQRLCLRR